MYDAIYSARLAFIHEITPAKRMCEVRPVVLVSIQLLSICSIHASDPLHTYQFFKSQKGSMEALNYLIITPLACARGNVIGFVCRLSSCLSVCLSLAQKSPDLEI